MIEAAALLVIIAGLIRPDWVRHRKAFGIAIIFLVLCAVSEAIGIGSTVMWTRGIMRYFDSGSSAPHVLPWVILSATRPASKIALLIAVLVAFWPGGRLFDIGGGGADKESSAADESQSTAE